MRFTRFFQDQLVSDLFPMVRTVSFALSFVFFWVYGNHKCTHAWSLQVARCELERRCNCGECGGSHITTRTQGFHFSRLDPRPAVEGERR